MLPPLSRRSSRKVFSGWKKVAIFLEERRAEVYSRILTEGGAKSVTLLKMPFQKRELFAGTAEVEEIQFAYIFSDPLLMEQDRNFAQFVSSRQPNVHICSYLYIIECLSKV